MMKLACIINLWDGEEHLEQSLSYVKDHVDLVIIIWQWKSNFGEDREPMRVNLKALADVLYEYSPIITGDKNDGFNNEKKKREIGIEQAKQNGCTHFFFMDTDEYLPDFKELKEEYIRSGKEGSILSIETYVGTPSYRVEPPMNYWVPFIQKLNHSPEMVCPKNVDRTRKYPAGSWAVLSKPMHHMSWVRSDIERKIRNSSAKHQRRNEDILKDYNIIMNMPVKSLESFYFKGRKIVNANNFTTFV